MAELAVQQSIHSLVFLVKGPEEDSPEEAAYVVGKTAVEHCPPAGIELGCRLAAST